MVILFFNQNQVKAPLVLPIISLYGINLSYDHYSSGPALQIVILLLSIQIGLTLDWSPVFRIYFIVQINTIFW